MDKYIVFLLDHLEERGIDLSTQEIASAHLVEEGFLDSFGILTLFMAVEDEFNIKITPDDMLNEKYVTVQGLAELIKIRLN